MGLLPDLMMSIRAYVFFLLFCIAAAVLGRADLYIPLALGMGKYVETVRFIGLQTAFLGERHPVGYYLGTEPFILVILRWMQ